MLMQAITYCAYDDGRKSQKAKGELIVHIAVLVIMLVFLAWLRHMAIG